MTAAETPVVFDCSGDRLFGILHAGANDAKTGVVIVVGGPQYRVGSHRQFVLMARQIAAAGFPVLRFDYRGMGDSEGETRTFEEIDDDIRASITRLLAEKRSLTSVKLLGLCDAASASLIYASSDSRVDGLVLLNPWVRTPEGEARSYLKHYYVQRLKQRSFWRKFLSGDFNVIRSTKELLGSVKTARGIPHSGVNEKDIPKKNFVSRMLAGLQDTNFRILILISGRDLTAKEYLDHCQAESGWRDALAQAKRNERVFPNADHTMADHRDLDEASSEIIRWLNADDDSLC